MRQLLSVYQACNHAWLPVPPWNYEPIVQRPGTILLCRSECVLIFSPAEVMIGCNDDTYKLSDIKARVPLPLVACTINNYSGGQWSDGQNLWHAQHNNRCGRH